MEICEHIFRPNDRIKWEVSREFDENVCLSTET